MRGLSRVKLAGPPIEIISERSVFLSFNFGLKLSSLQMPMYMLTLCSEPIAPSGISSVTPFLIIMEITKILINAFKTVMDGRPRICYLLPGTILVF